jgi:hypothetical protein
MIVKIAPRDANVLHAFAEDAKNLSRDKKIHTILGRFQMDLKSYQVNSDRFNMVRVVLKQVHTYARQLGNSSFKWAHIHRKYRVFLFPALYIYLSKVLPARARYHKRLDEVALIVQDIDSKVSGKKEG